MTPKIKIEGRLTGPLFEREGGARLRSAAKGAVLDASQEFVKQAGEDVGRAGRFGTSWTQGYTIQQQDGGSGPFLVSILHRIPFYKVFTKRTVIRGKPLLWIPLSFAADALGVRARDYPGRLFRVNRKDGKSPLLMASGRGGGKAEAKYSGHESVTIPKKFRTFEIAQEVYSHVGQYLAKRLG